MPRIFLITSIIKRASFLRARGHKNNKISALDKFDQSGQRYFESKRRKKAKTFNALPDSLSDVIGRMSGKSVVQVPDEVVSIIFRQSHERATHHDELNLVDAVTELLQLKNGKSS
jgi:hypothetical protein